MQDIALTKCLKVLKSQKSLFVSRFKIGSSRPRVGIEQPGQLETILQKGSRQKSSSASVYPLLGGGATPQNIADGPNCIALSPTRSTFRLEQFELR